MDIQEVDQKALTIIEEANLVTIKDTETYTQAGGLWASIQGIKKEVVETFKPIIDAAHKAHKEALKQKAKIFDPLDMAGRTVKKVMEIYDREQEQIRLAEEARLREIARKEEEERLLAEALEAERNGDTEEVEAILGAPAYVPPVIVQKTIPKLQGGPVFQTRWKFRVVDKRNVPEDFKVVDEVKVGQVVRAMKEATNIPGVEAYSERV